MLQGPVFRRSSAVEQLTVNQLVVGSIPTAGAKNLNKINDLLDFWPHLCVEQKVIKCYKVFLADLARISADFSQAFQTYNLQTFIPKA